MGEPKLLPLGPEVEREVRRIELDTLIAEFEPLLERISSGPWIADIGANRGNNWHLASFGVDENGVEWNLTTYGVRCSELGGDAEADVRFCAMARQLLPRLIEEWKVRRG